MRILRPTLVFNPKQSFALDLLNIAAVVEQMDSFWTNGDDPTMRSS